MKKTYLPIPIMLRLVLKVDVEPIFEFEAILIWKNQKWDWEVLKNLILIEILTLSFNLDLIEFNH